MANLIDVKVPDIGDFADIPVIEILVKVGDTIKKEDSLVALESDKATMEVPSTHAGVVRELKVKIGDKVSMGSLVLVLEAAEAEAMAVVLPKPVIPSPTLAPKAEGVTPAPSPTPAGTYKGNVDVTCEMLVLGAGPGGYSAAFRAADLGMKTVIVERYAQLGIPADLATYLPDLPDRLSWSHLVIARAGASTIAELTAAGRPAILIPLPSATDDHQTANVREMVDAGGARAIDEQDFTPVELAKQMQKLGLDGLGLVSARDFGVCALYRCRRHDHCRITKIVCIVADGNRYAALS